MPANKPPTLDHLKSKKKPVERSVRLVDDQELRQEFLDTVHEMEQAKLRSEAKPTDEGLKAIHERLRSETDELEQKVLEASIKFKFRSLGYKRYDELVAEHLITEEQIHELVAAGQLPEDGSKDLQWNPQTFPTALIAHCMVEPEGTPDDILEWLEDGSFNGSEIQELFATAMAVNVSASRVQLGNV